MTADWLASGRVDFTDNTLGITVDGGIAQTIGKACVTASKPKTS
jgi:hypothetical protein